MKRKKTSYLKLFILLYLGWFLMSGKVEAKFLIMGAVFAAIITFVAMPFLDISTKEGAIYNPLDLNLLKLLVYYLWLLKEIVKSAWDVSNVVMASKVKTEPQAIEVPVYLKNPLAKSVFANSITLTPGTITIDVPADDVFIVHALTDSAAEGLLSGEMEAKVAKLFGEAVPGEGEVAA